MYKPLDIKEFFIEGKDRERSHVLLHITEPSTDTEKEKGHFIVLAEVQNGSIEQIKHVQKMIDDLVSGFYETDTGDKPALEETLEYINKRSKHILKYEGSEIHCIVVNINEDDISFAYRGDPQALLYFNDEKGYKKINLIEEENKDKEQLFSSLIEGNIQTGDTFFLATPNVKKFVSGPKLKDLVVSSGIENSVKSIENKLNSTKPSLSFGGVVFQKKQDVKKQQNQTEKIETNYRPNDAGTEKQKKTKTPKNNDILVKIGEILTSFASKLGKFLLSVLVSLKDFFIALVILITNKGGQRKTIIRSLKRTIEDKKRDFKSLSIFSKILFSVTVLAALIFIGSLIFLQTKEAQQEKIKKYKQTVQAIQDKTNAADASMIYSNDSKAFGLLKEAKSMVNNLPKNISDEEKETSKKELKQKIAEKMKKLRKMKTVEPKKMAEYSEENKKEISRLAILDKQLVAYNPNSKKIHITNRNTESTETKTHTAISNIYNNTTPKEQDFTIFNSSPSEIAKLNKDSLTLSQQDISFPSENPNLSALSIYSRRLYAVDKNNNQIYKHSPTQTGFGKGTPWLNKEKDLSNAVSMAIDGSIYVLKNDGSIMKFFGGDEENFEVQGLDPKLENPTKLWTYNGIDNIYILEPTNQRVIVLDKQGKLQQQYTADQWKKPTGMIVKEDEGLVYILDQGTLYQFELE